MSQVLRLWQNVWATIQSEPRRPRTPIRIPDGHVENPAAPAPAAPPGSGDGVEIRPQKDYVVITLNQMFLADQRQWFTTIEPSVFASTEFVYGGRARIDPVVLGPRPDDKLPPGMVLRNLTLFGPHKYSGGAFTFTFVLSRLPVGNVARQVLEVVEATSKAVVPTLALDTYTKMGGVVMDGFERLLGLDGVHPLIGWRETINPDAGDAFRSGRWALIDALDPKPEEFWVVNNELWHGATRDRAEPYRKTDFMLFRFSRAENRSDTDLLPFYAPWKQAEASAGSPTGWDEAKANFGAMISAINVSPDLTWDQGKAIKAERRERLLALRTEALATQLMSDSSAARSDSEQEVAAILTLP